ncbi:MAG: hypothetical protein QOH28_3241 [Actinomycetota bacterium]|jgi:uncharacterized integral membrane protein|nr:hypothetical protein [Actinomycetota bacterium]
MADHPAGRSNREVTRVGAGLLLLALLIVFVLKNTNEVKVSFVFFDHRTRMIYVLVVTALVGVVLDRLWQRRRHH